MRELTYLIYILVYEATCLGGAAYIVFALDRSPWWLVAGVFLAASCIQPRNWFPVRGEQE